MIPVLGAAQQKPADTTEIIEVIITEYRLPMDAPAREISEQAINYTSGNTIARLATENTGLYIKSYGASNLATISFRGLTASHTKVYWNGLSLNSGMNGTIDLQTLPVALLQDISLSYAEDAMHIAAGSFGGALQARSRPAEMGLQVTANQEAGSFGTYNSMVKIAGGNERITQKMGLIYRQAENDYQYHNLAVAGEPATRLQNSSLMQAGGTYELYHKSGLSFKNLTTFTDREIPPTMLSPNSREQQQDWLSLNQLAYTKGIRKHTLQGQLNYKYDKIWYQDPIALIDAPSQTNTFQGVVQSKGPIANGLSYTARLEHTTQVAISTGITDRQQQNTTGLMADLAYRLRWFVSSFTMRQDLIDGTLTPFLPALSVGATTKHWSISMLAQRNYRYPTLNDRYWQPGGNPDLQPERGLNLELRNELKPIKSKMLELSISNTAYYMNIDNWILWQPSPFGFWGAMNVRQVVSRGIENQLQLTLKKTVTTQITANYHFNKATTVESANLNDASEGKLLIYSPQHIFNLSVSEQFRGWYIYFNMQYTGLRYATTDNLQELDPFLLGNIRLGKTLQFNRHQLELYLSIDNLWNTEYQNVAWRPMPPRSFLGGIRYKFARS